jgi:hypothetical protein
MQVPISSTFNFLVPKPASKKDFTTKDSANTKRPESTQVQPLQILVSLALQRTSGATKPRYCLSVAIAFAAEQYVSACVSSVLIQIDPPP